jgi:hypothetical protein
MRSTEYIGVGQSGYNAGRREHDPALEREQQVHNPAYPRSVKDEEDPLRENLDTDDRWVGRGGPTPADQPEDERTD